MFALRSNQDTITFAYLVSRSEIPSRHHHRPRSEHLITKDLSPDVLGTLHASQALWPHIHPRPTKDPSLIFSCFSSFLFAKRVYPDLRHPHYEFRLIHSLLQDGPFVGLHRAGKKFLVSFYFYMHCMNQSHFPFVQTMMLCARSIILFSTRLWRWVCIFGDPCRATDSPEYSGELESTRVVLISTSNKK
jgi:hypothetical protein